MTDIFCFAESWLSFSNAFKDVKLLLCFAVVYLVLSFKGFKSLTSLMLMFLYFFFFNLFLITCMLSSSIISTFERSLFRCKSFFSYFFSADLKKMH